MKKYIKCFTAIFICGFIFVFFLATCTVKKDIYNATAKELNQVQEIGNKLSEEIQQYCKTYDIHKVDDLEIKGLGEKRKSELKKIYK